MDPPPAERVIWVGGNDRWAVFTGGGTSVYRPWDVKRKEPQLVWEVPTRYTWYQQ